LGNQKAILYYQLLCSTDLLNAQPFTVSILTDRLLNILSDEIYDSQKYDLSNNQEFI